jgi:hypothetical protein
VQVEGGVLHIDKSRIEAGEPDQFDDLRVGDAADVGPQGQAALAQDALDPIVFHVLLSSRVAISARPRGRIARAAAGWR